uniref:uncharacterized protein LOC117705059 n=1 Tax=Arvicanthis niloticus TaxID=61156 RepID=UPI001486ED44|nr:uncharacterized protein LOC117705059 [Arvicanthis niloticus]
MPAQAPAFHSQAVFRSHRVPGGKKAHDCHFLPKRVCRGPGTAFQNQSSLLLIHSAISWTRKQLRTSGCWSLSGLDTALVFLMNRSPHGSSSPWPGWGSSDRGDVLVKGH